MLYIVSVFIYKSRVKVPRMLAQFHKSKKEEYLHMNKVLARVVRLVIETNTLTGNYRNIANLNVFRLN